jgi:hypothetical protein
MRISIFFSLIFVGVSVFATSQDQELLLKDYPFKSESVKDRTKILKEIDSQFASSTCEQGSVFGFDLVEIEFQAKKGMAESLYADLTQAFFVAAINESLKTEMDAQSCENNNYLKKYLARKETETSKSPVQPAQICQLWRDLFKSARAKNVNSNEMQKNFWRARVGTFELALWNFEDNLKASGAPTLAWENWRKLTTLTFPQLNVKSCESLRADLGPLEDQNSDLVLLKALTFAAAESEEEAQEETRLADQLADEIIKFSPTKRQPAKQ